MLHGVQRRIGGAIRHWKGAAPLAIVGCLLAGVISVGTAASGLDFGSSPASATGRTPFLHGAYVGPANVSGLAKFSSATKTSSALASDSIPYAGGWTHLDGAGGSLAWVLQSGWSRTHYALSLAVPMIPTNEEGVPVATLAEGASGAYNGYYMTLARTLVAAGEGNAYLRLGWEFDGGWYAWSAQSPNAEVNFAEYFRQIVTAMRSIPGEHFRFVWNPTAAAFADGYDLALAYPGNSFVNEIGLDDYDQTWLSPQTSKVEWDETTLPNLVAAHRYAASRHKPLVVCEWGLSIRTDGHGLGDDPRFINNFVAWMKNPVNDIEYESYFNFDADGQKDSITDGDTPKSLAAFIADFGQSSHTGNNETMDIIIGAVVVGAGLVVTLGAWRRLRRRHVTPEGEGNTTRADTSPI